MDTSDTESKREASIHDIENGIAQREKECQELASELDALTNQPERALASKYLEQAQQERIRLNTTMAKRLQELQAEIK